MTTETRPNSALIDVYPPHIVQKVLQLLNILELSRLLTRKLNERSNKGLKEMVRLERQTQEYTIQTTATPETLKIINNMMLDRINDLRREGHEGLVGDIIKEHIKKQTPPPK